MRTRFLAAAGPPQRLSELLETQHWPSSLPEGWKVRLHREDLIIFVPDAEPCLPFAKGAILGTLFRRADAQRVSEPDCELGRNVERTLGQCLIDRHWGAWFAIFSAGAGHWAMRDPSAFAPTYCRTAEGLSLYFSGLDVALELGLELGRPDLEFLRHWLTFPHLRTRRTGIEGTSELLPGTRREVTGGHETLTVAWSPWRFAASDRQIVDLERATECLRRETLNTVPAQARGCEDLLLELSGGLDSSIVAATLKWAGLSFRTLNFVTRTAEGDERRYARAVAAATSVRHYEMEEADAPLDFGHPQRRRLRPGLSPVMAPLHRQFAAYGEQVGARTFVTGAGGDNVFCYLTTAAPVIDAWRALGPASALGVLRDVSEMCGCTAWTTARFALRKAVRAFNAPTPWRRDVDFLVPAAAPSAPEHHPWLEAPSGALAGKREHIAALLRIQHVTDPETRMSRLPFLHPLIAQPIIELCLRIPTWLWVEGGRNRAVARAAFRGLLPDDVLDRRSKGRLEGMCVRAYLRHRVEIDDLLLGGLLRQVGFLEPDALESYLERQAPPTDARYFRIFELLSAELWLRSCWR